MIFKPQANTATNSTAMMCAMNLCNNLCSPEIDKV